MAELSHNTPELIPSLSSEYSSLVNKINHELANSTRSMRYVPLRGGLQVSNIAEQVSAEVVARDLDTIICVGRSRLPNPEYNDTSSRGNYTLAASCISNTVRTAELYKTAGAQGNKPEVISSGWMENKHLDTFLELPAIARQIGITVVSLCDLSVQDFRTHTDKLSLPEFEEHQLIDQFRRYPMDSEAVQMAQEMRLRGIPEESIYEEDESFDTITNFLFCRERLERTGAKNIAVVATIDHLPRIMWLADYILPDDVAVSFVESEPLLSQEDFDATCQREHKSFLAGSKWLKSVPRDPESMLNLIYNGYLNPKTRRNAADIARNVATQS